MKKRNYKEIKKRISLKFFLSLFNKEKLKYYFTRLVGLRLKSEEIAFSVAVGAFIGLTVPIGAQVVAAIPVSLLLRTNFTLTFCATLITNPITAIPIYYIHIKIGEYILGYRNVWQNYSALINNPSVSNFVSLSGESIAAYAAGALISASLFSILTYFVLKKIIILKRRKTEAISTLEESLD